MVSTTLSPLSLMTMLPVPFVTFLLKVITRLPVTTTPVASSKGLRVAMAGANSVVKFQVEPPEKPAKLALEVS